MIRRIQDWLARTAARYERLHLHHAPAIRWPEGRQFFPGEGVETALTAAGEGERRSREWRIEILDTLAGRELLVLDRGARVAAAEIPAEEPETGGATALQAPLCLEDGAGRVFLAAWTRAELALMMQPAEEARGQVLALPVDTLIGALDPPLGLVVNPGWQGSIRWEPRDLARWLAGRPSS
ncbi:MAG: SseB family protein [Opitutales bacterium]